MNVAPTLFTSCNALPPEGGLPGLGRPGAGRVMTGVNASIAT